MAILDEYHCSTLWRPQAMATTVETGHDRRSTGVIDLDTGGVRLLVARARAGYENFFFGRLEAWSLY